MAKDDYFVIVYKLLRYLYDCLKKDDIPDMEIIDAEYFSIGNRYWEYILTNLCKDGYVTGITLVPVAGRLDKGVKVSKSISITPKGIQYLEENSMFNKVKDALKDISDIIPM